MLISAGFGWFRLVYVRGKKLKEVERSEANGVNVKPATSPWAGFVVPNSIPAFLRRSPSSPNSSVGKGPEPTLDV